MWQNSNHQKCLVMVREWTDGQKVSSPTLKKMGYTSAAPVILEHDSEARIRTRRLEKHMWPSLHHRRVAFPLSGISHAHSVFLANHTTVSGDQMGERLLSRMMWAVERKKLPQYLLDSNSTPKLRVLFFTIRLLPSIHCAELD